MGSARATSVSKSHDSLASKKWGGNLNANCRRGPLMASNDSHHPSRRVARRADRPKGRRPAALRAAAAVAMLPCFGLVPFFFSQENLTGGLIAAVCGSVCLAFAFSRRREP